MFDSLLPSEPIPGTDLNEPEDEILGSFRYLTPVRFRKAKIPLHDLPIDFVQDTVEEWKRSTEQDVGDDTNSPYVDFSAVLFIFDDLRRKVEIRATDQVRPGKSIRKVLGHLGQTEVRDLNVRVAGFADKEDILWLEIPVHDSLAVDVGDSFDQVADKNLSFRFRVVLLLYNTIE